MRLLFDVLVEQGRFHRVKGFEETFFPDSGLFAGEAHGQEGESVTGETVGGISLSVLGMNVGGMLKIEHTELGRALKVFNVAQYIFVLFVKSLSNDQRGGERHAVFGLNHVLNGGFKDFLSFGGGDFSFRHVRLLPCLYCVFRAAHGVFSLAETCPVLCWSVCSIP